MIVVRYAVCSERGRKPVTRQVCESPEEAAQVLEKLRRQDLVDPEDDGIDFVVDMHQFARVADPPGPRHFADVYQTFNAVLELDERPVTHHVDHRSPHGRTDRVFFIDAVPRAGCLHPPGTGTVAPNRP